MINSKGLVIHNTHKLPFVENKFDMKMNIVC